MSERYEERHHDITPALNNELTWLGIPRVLLFCAIVLALVVLVVTWSLFWFGFTLLTLCLVSIWATTSDPAFPQILYTALRQWTHGPIWDPFQPQDWKLNLCGFLHDGECFFTYTGDVGVVMECAGVDTDCLSPEKRDRIAKRIENARRNLEDRIILQEIYFRREQAPAASESCGNDAADLSAKSRAEHMRKEGLFTERLCYVLLALDPRSQLTIWKAIRRQQIGLYLSRWSYKRKFEVEIEELRERVRQKAQDFVMELRDVMEMRVLSREQAFPVLWRLLNFGEGEPAGYCPDDELGSRISDSFIGCDQRHLEIDDVHVVVQAMKSPPKESRPLTFEGLREVQGNFQIITTWQQHSPERQRDVAKKKSHWWRSRYRGIPGKSAAGVERLADGIKLQAVDDLEQIERQLGKRDFQGYFSLTAVVYDAGSRKARSTEAEVRSVFTRAGATVLVDRFNQLNALFSTVPGGYERLFRRMVLMNSQASDLALWAKSDEGERWNSHLNSECLGIMRTVQGTPFCFNLHGRPQDGSPDVAHTIISGRTGTGKSALGGLLTLLLLKYAPHVLICDRGGSYHGVVEAAGGVTATVAPGQPCGLNPFAEHLTAEHLSFLGLFVRTLIECSGPQMAGPQQDELHGEIGRLYDLEPRFRTLGYLSLGLSRALAKPLGRWVRGGADGEWFDNEHDAVAQRRIQYFDLPQKLNDDVARAYLLCILHRWRKVVTDPKNIAVLKASFIDEAANLFRENGDLAGYAVEAAETFRKHNGCLVLLTQSATSFLAPAFRPLIQNVETQIFFSDPRMSDSLAHDLGLTTEERDAIRDLCGRREILFKQGSRSKHLQTCLDPLTLWLCTTDAMQKVKRQEAFKKYGVTKALEVLTNNGHDSHFQPAAD